MTQLLNEAIEAARQLSPGEQDEIARAIMDLVGASQDDVYVLSPEEEAAIDEGIAAADRGEFATKEEVDAILAKYRL